MIVSAVCALAGILCGLAHPAEGFHSAFVILFLPGAVVFLTENTSRQRQFWICTLFYSVVNLICLRWLCSHLFSDYLIYLSWILLSFLLGMGFGLFSLFTRCCHRNGYLSLFVLPLIWCAIEWSRHFLFSGYPWLPFGSYAAANLKLMQWGSILGVSGLSYFVMLLNLIFMRALFRNQSLQGLRSVSTLFIGMLIAGTVRLGLFSSPPISTTLFGIVQTGLYPHHKSYSPGYFEYWVPPELMLSDWLDLLCEKAVATTILFPECVFPFSSNALRLHVGAISLSQNGSWFTADLDEQVQSFLSPAFVFKTMAQKLTKQIIVGLEEEGGQEGFNSAFLFSRSHEMKTSRKSMLVPFGEYPTWLRHLSLRLVQGGAFQFGPMEKPLFHLDNGLVTQTTICFEDTFPHLIRKWFKNADFHLNITNDGWFLSPLLSRQHLIHSQLRSVENGITTLRVTATGPSAHISPFGEIIDQTPISLNVVQPVPLYVEWGITPNRIATIYSLFGDLWILVVIISGAIFVRCVNRSHYF